jgi:hypothetical protein
MVAFGTKYRHRVDMVWNSVPSTITVGASNPESAGYQGVSVPLAYTYGATWSGSTTEAHENTGTIATCLTCHFAHGTSATMGTNSAGAAQTGAQDSSLLRWNNRGVCQACHQKS